MSNPNIVATIKARSEDAQANVSKFLDAKNIPEAKYYGGMRDGLLAAVSIIESQQAYDERTAMLYRQDARP